MTDKASELKDADGGFYAIRGFVFQFDKSILEILLNPDSNVEIEQIQDIATESYYIQVKYKASQTYAPSKVRTAIIQLLEESRINTSRHYLLYCYFKDKTAGRQNLSITELDEILGKECKKYSIQDKERFIKVFVLEFADDFQKQFSVLLKQIQTLFNLKNMEEAVMHHASFRAFILECAIKKQKTQRRVTLSMLRDTLNRNEKIIFESAYSKYLTNSKYISYLKKQYFTYKKPNVKDNERLFVIDADSFIRDAEMIQAIVNISNRYYIKDASAAPYICFTSLASERMTTLKRKLWDKGLYFTDGTHFKDDNFRMYSLLEKVHIHPNNVIKYKLINEGNLVQVLHEHTFDEVFIFLNTSSLETIITDKYMKFHLSRTRDILKVIE